MEIHKLWPFAGIYLLMLVFMIAGWTERKAAGSGRVSPFGRMAAGVLKLTWWQRRNRPEPYPLQQVLKSLKPAEQRDQAWRIYQMEQYSKAFLIVFLCNTSAFLLSLYVMTGGGSGDPVTFERNEPGAGGRQEELLVTVPGVLEQEYFEWYLAGRSYTAEEAEKQVELAAEGLVQVILGENESLDAVRSDLMLIEQFPESAVQISWTLSSYEYMNRGGELIADIPEGGARLQLRAELVCQESRKEVVLEVQLLEPERSPEEQMLVRLQEQVEEAQQQQEAEKEFRLPDETDGYPVIWEVPDDQTPLYLLILGLVVSVLLIRSGDENIHKQADQRKKQMLIDYPEITGRMTLLLEAGMPVRKAWEEIVRSYQSKRKKEIRYAYEEMMITCFEMQGGVSEVKAYEHFGERCRVQQYRKFSSVLVQNLKKGAEGLAVLFRTESQMALEERRMQARKAGEEAATKLLVPMFLMLLVVLIIVMVPAFISMEL